MRGSGCCSPTTETGVAGSSSPPAGSRTPPASTPQQRHLSPEVATLFLGYGYQVWLLPGEPRRFVFLGLRGQSIFVDPRSRLVMVQTAVRKRPSGDPSARETRLFWDAVVGTLGN
jgi:CubicO group peptidase (beta-lactamase class C family)